MVFPVFLSNVGCSKFSPAFECAWPEDKKSLAEITFLVESTCWHTYWQRQLLIVIDFNTTWSGIFKVTFYLILAVELTGECCRMFESEQQCSEYVCLSGKPVCFILKLWPFLLNRRSSSIRGNVWAFSCIFLNINKLSGPPDLTYFLMNKIFTIQ